MGFSLGVYVCIMDLVVKLAVKNLVITFGELVLWTMFVNENIKAYLHAWLALIIVSRCNIRFCKAN